MVPSVAAAQRAASLGAPARRLVVAVLVAALTLTLVGAARWLAVSIPVAATSSALTATDWQAISALTYAGRPHGNAVEFSNRSQGIDAVVSRSGTSVTTAAGGLTVALAGLSRVLAETATISSDTVSVSGARAELAHRVGATGITEWWVNRTNGLEQGFTIAARPSGVGKLRLNLALGGSLVPQLIAADSLAFIGTDLRYSGLKVWDASGRYVDARFELDNRTLAIVVDDAAATYPLTIDPTFAQQAYFKASNTEADDEFGASVAIDGDTVVIGAVGEDSNLAPNQADNSFSAAGAAYVFVRVEGAWAQQAYLKASNPGADDEFGWAVAISGDTIVVGAPYEDSSSTGVNSPPNELGSNSGAAYVFTRSGTIWSQQASLKASNTGNDDRFGAAVAVSGDTVVVGAPQEASSSTGLNSTPDELAANAGAAYVFTRSGVTWTQQAYVKASNTAATNFFGAAVSVDGETVAIGAWAENSGSTGVNGSQSQTGGPASGAAYVLTRTGVTWTQQAFVKASNTGGGDHFGWSLDVDGDMLVVGADNEASNATGVDGNQADNSAPAAGAAYVFGRTGSTWTQDAYLKASNTELLDRFGHDVALDGDVVIVGAYVEDSVATGFNGDDSDNSASNAGAAYAFVRSGVSWSQQAYVKASNTDISDVFGHAVDLSGDTMLIGAYGEDSDATGVNGTQADDSAGEAGAAYAIRVTSAFTEEAYLKASNTDPLDKFGTSVAISGDTVVVGAIWEASGTGLESSNSAAASGAAYVFTRSGTTWSQQAYLKPSNIDPGDNFGDAVAISGDTIVVGAPFEDSNTTGVNTVPNALAATSGAAFVFTRSGTTWTEQAYLKASNTDSGDNFGDSVSISGDTIIVGAPEEDSGANGIGGNEALNGATNAGAAYVFTRTGSTWSQQAYVKASNSNDGDHFGAAVAISDSTIVVGAIDEASSNGLQGDNAAGGAGAVYVFTRTGVTWAQQAYLKASNIGGIDNFGYSVALAGNNLVVGAPFEDSGADGVDGDSADESASSAGAAYVFHRDGTTWTQQAYLKASNSDGGDQFGFDVAMGVDAVIVGARFEASDSTGINGDEADDSAVQAGGAYFFSRTNGTWEQDAYVKASNTDASDFFGSAVATSGDTVVTGAPGEASNATGVNGNGADNTEGGAGAAYVGVDEGCFAPPFSDVATTHPFCAEILWIAENEISTGFQDGTYQPSIDVTRQAMSAFMARLAGATLSACTVAPFTDVPTSHPFCEEIQWMKEDGISTGFPDGTYQPASAVTRQAMSAFMARLASAELPACVVAPFSDVPVGHPFCEEIKWMKSTGVSAGFSDGTYRPETVVTRQAMSAFLYRVSVFAR